MFDLKKKHKRVLTQRFFSEKSKNLTVGFWRESWNASMDVVQTLTTHRSGSSLRVKINICKLPHNNNFILFSLHCSDFECKAKNPLVFGTNASIIKLIAEHFLDRACA
jgi:hypothetical protein